MEGWTELSVSNIYNNMASNFCAYIIGMKATYMFISEQWTDLNSPFPSFDY